MPAHSRSSHAVVGVGGSLPVSSPPSPGPPVGAPVGAVVGRRGAPSSPSGFVGSPPPSAPRSQRPTVQPLPSPGEGINWPAHINSRATIHHLILVASCFRTCHRDCTDELCEKRPCEFCMSLFCTSLRCALITHVGSELCCEVQRARGCHKCGALECWSSSVRVRQWLRSCCVRPSCLRFRSNMGQPGTNYTGMDMGTATKHAMQESSVS